MDAYKLSLAERAILANQYRILSVLLPDEAESLEAKAEIVSRGYEGLYHEVLPSDNPIPAEITSEVHQILTMYRLVTHSIDSLTEQEQEEIDAKAVRFDGFDANNDIHYAVADFYINQKRLYAELADHYLNSHSPFSLERYRAMLPVYQRLLPEVNYRPQYKLSKEELTEMVKAVNS